jgi:KaiC/GvpD/RAD55 family RecA-like ATPase
MSQRRLSGLDLGEGCALPEHPDQTAELQAIVAGQAIHRRAEDFLHLPWPDLDGVVGGIAPGDVWFLGGYSGMGKTTFLMSALDLWYGMGKRVFYAGLESTPNILRTIWACYRLGLSPGDVLSGALVGREDWELTRARLIAEIKAQTKDGVAEQIYFSSEKFVNEERLAFLCEQAVALASDVMIIDHVDHLEGTGNLYESSVRSMKVLLSLAQDNGIRVLAATQFNNEMIKGSKVGMHQAPAPTAVYQGGHKRQIASGMLGIYRPFKFDITTEELKAFKDGKLDSSLVVEPNVMAVTVMKHRLYGNRQGKQVFLRVDRGRVVDMHERDMHKTVDDDGFRIAQ